MAGVYERVLVRIEQQPGEVRVRRISLPMWEKTWVAARSLALAAAPNGRGTLNGRASPQGLGPIVRPASAQGNVVVIGGGLAGISAALACADAGARVTLLEVRPRLGGAAYSFERDGLSVDNGQHVFLRCCTEYRKLLERLGTADLAPVQRRLDIPVLAPGVRKGRLSRNGLPAPLHLAGAIAGYPFLIPSDRLQAMRAALALARLDPADPALDRRTFGEWLAEHGQSRAAVETLWNLIALPTLNLHANGASLALAAFVFQTGLLRDRSAGDVGWARVPLSALHGEPAERALRAAGVDLRLRWKAEHVGVTSEGGFEVAGPDSAFSADAVVVAVPHDRAAALLPDGALDDSHADLGALGSSPIVNLHVVYDRRVTDLPFAAGVRTPVQFVFDRTMPAGLERGQYLAVSLSGADEVIGMDSERLRAQYLPALATLFPAACRASVERFFVTREHAATFRASPGVAALRPGARTDIPGLLLAGAWTATGWPATMEGAVRSGHSAAREALASLARSRERLEVAA
jgi:squalene-associated FAD-dependent desaturase